MNGAADHAPVANGVINGGMSLPTGEAEDYQHPMDAEEFRRRGYEMVDWICDYHSRVEGLPTRSQVHPGYLAPQLPAQVPAEGEPWPAIMADVERHIMPGVTHWQSPNFFAYYPANSSYPGLLGEMMSGAFNTIGFSWIGSPAATELETIMMDWLGKLLDLPEAFLSSSGTGGGGVIQGTASEAEVVVLLAARARTLAQAGHSQEDQGRLVVYTSDQAHSSVQKACMISGTAHCRTLRTNAAHHWALQADTLEAAIEEDLAAGLIPSFVTATIGTTSTCTVDDIPALAAVCQKHGIWLHIDGAYAGVAAALPEQRHHFAGLASCDSFSTNMHKALLTNFDCCALWVQDAEPLKKALSLTPEFLRAKGNALDYKDWQLPLGRRFRALKAWFVLRTYGVSGVQGYLRHHFRMAAEFAELVQADPRFELSAPQHFGLVCFHAKGASRETNAALLEAVNASGKAFLIHTELGQGDAKQFMIRMAIGGTHTQPRHVRAAWAAIQEAADAILAPTSAPANIEVAAPDTDQC
eukprot:CAMPEP_0206146194 /NCGR_PEP_ID=MMETSP1473-20131121/29683_1 /ASSEMBLY_ACC=CAM_ASM_001109 /TAXON_ID=1461547 /ORGANISM="Stichococcus sp, Strain RCC1054" /LENGTH=524 /DNA_ID=CAMNT_0053542663 /DNA_START=1063 /DNA_END=2637 /DNA_ORIENTATION=+